MVSYTCIATFLTAIMGSDRLKFSKIYIPQNEILMVTPLTASYAVKRSLHRVSLRDVSLRNEIDVTGVSLGGRSQPPPPCLMREHVYCSRLLDVSDG